jgi:hypothetical protein
MIVQLATAISNFGSTQYGIHLEDCAGVTVEFSAISQASRAVFQSGTNHDVVYDGLVLNGLGANGTAFTFAPSDRNITVHSPTFQGTVGKRYLAAPNASIRVEGAATP